MQLLLLLVQLLPTIFSVIRAVEAAVPNPGQGTAKLNYVLNAVQGIALDAPALVGAGASVAGAAKVGDVPGMADALTHVVTASVKLFNDTGIFQKSGAVQSITAAQLARDATVTG